MSRKYPFLAARSRTTKRLASVSAVLVLTVSWSATVVAGLTPAQSCEKAKGKAVGKLVSCVANERGKEMGGKEPNYARCYADLPERFATAEDKSGGACPTTGDVRPVFSSLEHAFSVTTGVIKSLQGGTRFVDNGDGTVTDTVTGLVWEQKTDDGSIHDYDDVYTWSGTGTAADGTIFTGFLATLNDATGGCFAGQCDWRLPTVAELESLWKLDQPCGTTEPTPCIDQTIFGPTHTGTGPPANYSWSATTYNAFPTTAWAVGFNQLVGNTGKMVNEYARAVRGGSSSSER